MPIGPRERSTDAPAHAGFRYNGSAYSSPFPVDDQPTNFVRRLLDKVRHEYLSPAQIVEYIALDRAELRGMFRSSEQWQKLDRYWQWPLAQACGSAEVTVKFHGKKLPPWDADPRAWDLRVRHACQIRLEPLPHETVYWEGIDHALAPGETYAQAAARIVGGPYAEVLSRMA